jgi:hypothetical protein
MREFNQQDLSWHFSVLEELYFANYNYILYDSFKIDHEQEFHG